ncbi:hypothetical protein [Sphingobacterium sp.]|uniref:hypothetical protein n=1 Tax=Sphingobacterium sp. TaxID=341027 RepID=UPI0031E3B699
MARTAPRTSTIRQLFALSGNECALPGCRHALINNEGRIEDVQGIDYNYKDLIVKELVGTEYIVDVKADLYLCI